MPCIDECHTLRDECFSSGIVLSTITVFEIANLTKRGLNSTLTVSCDNFVQPCIEHFLCIYQVLLGIPLDEVQCSEGLIKNLNDTLLFVQRRQRNRK